MNVYDPATGVPIPLSALSFPSSGQQRTEPTNERQQQQQQHFGYDAYTRNEGVGRREARNETVGNTERIVDNLITNPGFWATVFTTLQQNENIAEEIRRDLEEQEIRATTQSNINNNNEHRDGDGTGNNVGGRRGAGDNDGYDRSTRPEHLADLYEIMSRGFHNNNSGEAAAGVQRLDVLMDELDVAALWSARDVTISFGPLTRVLMRLLTGRYATEEENLIVRMLNVGVERACRNFGFEDYDPRSRDTPVSTEPFHITYRRRGRVLRDFAAFRYMLEVAERMGRFGRKHKQDLILLYMTLTTPEVRLHRKWNASDRETASAFRDRVTGYAISTPPVMARPMSIEMHLDSVFGNVSTNTRLLERSLAAALNNRNRKTAHDELTRDVESLLGDARLLDLSNDGAGAALVSSRQFTRNKEHVALRHMLETSAVVSMMAEEYRVFVAGAPPSRCAADGRSGRKRPSGVSGGRNGRLLRRPIFFTFKPNSRALTTTEK